MHAATLLAGCCVTGACFAASFDAPSTKIAGVNFVAEGFEGPYPYDSPQSLSALEAVKSTGMTWVQFSFPWYTSSINSTGPIYRVDAPCPSGAPFGNASSPETAAVMTAVAHAQSLGLKVVLRPMVDPDWRNHSVNPTSLYRGDIGTHFSPTQWEAWFVSYTAYMAYWAELGQSAGVNAFCIGAELTATQSQSALWRGTFAAVRALYNHGPVFYSSTGGDMDWWDASDYVAWDVYPNLGFPGDPDSVTVQELTSAWGSGTLALLAAVARKHGKPALLAESGICSINKAGIYTDPSYYFCYTSPVDMATQAKFYVAMLTSVWGQEEVAGVFFWKWAWQGGPADPTFFPLNKTAQAAVATFLGSHA